MLPSSNRAKSCAEMPQCVGGKQWCQQRLPPRLFCISPSSFAEEGLGLGLCVARQGHTLRDAVLLLPGKVRTPLPVFADDRLRYRARPGQALSRYPLGQGKAFSRPTLKHIRICPRRRVRGPGCPLARALSPREGRGQVALSPDAGMLGAPPARHGRALARFAVPALLPGTGTVRQSGPSPCHASRLLQEGSAGISFRSPSRRN